MNDQGRNWCFTYNLPEGADLPTETGAIQAQLTHNRTVLYAVYQIERAPTTGQLHLQGFIHFSRNKRGSAVKRLIADTAHLEAAKGTAAQNKDYCTKDETRLEGTEPWEYGDCPGKPGARQDILRVRNAIQEGSSNVMLWEDHFEVMARNYRAIAEYRRVLVESIDRPDHPAVKIYYGQTGTGKTRRAYYEAKQVGTPFFVCLPSCDKATAWFDGWNGVDPIIIDDFDSEYEIGFFKRLLDRYPISVPVKGGFVPCRVKHMWITSNTDPGDWYAGAPLKHYAAVQRRVNQAYREHITHWEPPSLPAAECLPVSSDISCASTEVLFENLMETGRLLTEMTEHPADADDIDE